MHPLRRYLDPRRSLASAIGWLVFALSTGLVLVASAWVGEIVRTNLIDMRGRQLDRAADNIADELNLSFALRLQSVRALAAMLATQLRDENQATLRQMLENLQSASPEFRGIAVADRQGRILASTRGGVDSASVADRSWFAHGLTGSKIGEVRVLPGTTNAASGATDEEIESVMSLITPVVDTKGRVDGVIDVQLRGRWLLDLAVRLGNEARGEAGTEALLLDHDGKVLIGPADLKGKRLESTNDSTGAAAQAVGINVPGASAESPSHVERMVDGSQFLVARAIPATADPLYALGWHVVVREPLKGVKQNAGFLQGRITAILLGLGLLAALLGVLLARRLTRELDAIARSADAIRAGATQSIAAPAGRNEAARLGRALDELLTSLQKERSELRALNAELDQRVAARTREIERLADEARYDAVVRERLKIARDLHDTLAHSMMALLTEIRLLKRLATANPEAMVEELRHAEETAHQGLKEARAAIAQMRFNPVRDAGLAAALGDFVKLFVERTGIPVDYTSDAQPGAFADARAETLFRIAEEAMRNVERHAGATRVTVSLRAPGGGDGLTLTISDDGAGFEVAAAHPGHYGLAGLREQAQLIGAVLSIQSAQGHGTTISVTLATALDS